MDPDTEVSAECIPPADQIDKRENESFDAEAENEVNLRHDLVNHSGGHEMALQEENNAQTQPNHSEHKVVEMELRAAQEKIEKLQGDPVDAEKKLADSQRNLSATSKQAEDYEKEKKNQEDIAKEASEESLKLRSAIEAAETSAREAEQTVKNLESELQKTKAQILENNQAQTLLEETKVEKAKIEEENSLLRAKLVQLEGHMADGKSHAADLERKLQHAEMELKKQEDSLSAAEETTLMVKEQLHALEERLTGAQDELQAKDDTLWSLQAEVASLKSNISELSTTSEENLKVLEGEHQKQMKAFEERYEDLQKALLELEGKNAQLQESLDVAGMDAETARKKVAELEQELDNLSQDKCKVEEGAADFQLQLKSTEELLSKQVDSLKIAEENAKEANEEVVHLQSAVKSTEEKLRVSEEVADSLQLRVTELTAREVKSVERLKELEDGFENMQLELQSKLETSEGNFKSLMSQLEEKAAQLQESLAAATLEGEGAKKKASDLELELDSLRHIQVELEEKVRISEEKCSQHENSVETFRTRGAELEGLITEHKTKADDAYGKVASLEAAILEAQDKAADLEMKLKLAEDNSSLLQDTSIARIAELERSAKEYEAQIAELEAACASVKSTEQDTLEMLRSTEKMLEKRQSEMKSASQRIGELELAVEGMESELKGALKREMLSSEERSSVEEKIVKLEAFIAKLEGERREYESREHRHMSLVEKGQVDLHEASVKEGKLREEISSLQAAKSELQGLLSHIESEKQMTIAQLDSTQKSFVELNEQLVQERQQLQQQIATIMQENGDLTETLASTQEKLHASLAAAELSAKQVQESSLKESTINAQIEDLNLQLKKALDACTHVERLEQENGNLSQKFASTQEKLDAALGAGEVFARQLQEAEMKDSTLNAQIEDLKVQLGKATDACAQVEKLEQTLQNSITTEEHQRRMDQVLATSRLAESKLADVEEELSRSKLEINRVQKAFNEQETHVKELELKSVKVFDQATSEFTKTREIEVDSQSPGKMKNRKKKGFTWEVDGDAVTNTKAAVKPAPLRMHNLNQFVAHILIAAASLFIGFWLAKEIHL